MGQLVQTVRLYQATNDADIEAAIQNDLAVFPASENWYIKSIVHSASSRRHFDLHATVIFEKEVNRHPRSYSAVLLSNQLLTPPIGSTPGLIFAVTRPAPGEKIGIFSAAVRLEFTKIVTPVLYNATLNILRQSDNAILAGVAVNYEPEPPYDIEVPAITPLGTVPLLGAVLKRARPLHAEELFNWSPSQFIIEADDTIFVLARTYSYLPETTPDIYEGRGFAFIFYHKLDANNNPI